LVEFEAEVVRAFLLAGPSTWGPESGKNGGLIATPKTHSNKNHKQCDEMAKKRDELVTGAFFRVEKTADAGRRQAGEDCSHGDTKARRKSLADGLPPD
jgi:hypothetical protein